VAEEKSGEVDHSNRYPDAPKTEFQVTEARPIPGVTVSEGHLVEAESANGLAQAATRENTIAPRTRERTCCGKTLFMVARLMVRGPEVKK
jgi:hypothetical protein